MPSAPPTPPGLRVCALFAALALVAGCASAPKSTPVNETLLLIAGLSPQAILSGREIGRINAHIPAAFRDGVLHAEAFGRTVYTYDRLAGKAGKLIAPGGRASFGFPPVGWLTERTPSGLGVSFVVETKNSLGVAAEVTSSEQGELQANAISPPRKLTPQEIILWKARQLAYTTHFKPCAKRYNPVVIPARVAGVDLIYVYLLPSSADPATIYLGGYHRIAISPDGGVILEDHSFTHNCITLQRNRKTAAAKITEIVSANPTSIQVYASLRYDMPVYVETISNHLIWKVEKGRVTLVPK